MYLPYGPDVALQGLHPKYSTGNVSQTYLHVTVCCNTVHNGYTMEAAHVSNNTCGMCKQRNFIVEESYSVFRKAFAAADVKQSKTVLERQTQHLCMVSVISRFF